MLLFIRCGYPDVYCAALFKYISCYCLSGFKVPAILVSGYSNTSHVIVYLTPLFQSERVMLFKYISCYCLSEMADQYEQLNTFKYISCYCLSRTVLRSTGSWEAIQIHLMLLFIWLLFLIIILAVKFKYISCYCLSIRLRKIRGYPRIQIHLMLLFIPAEPICA